LTHSGDHWSPSVVAPVGGAPDQVTVVPESVRSAPRRIDGDTDGAGYQVTVDSSPREYSRLASLTHGFT
jgi:hypothetical protein